MKIVIIGGVAAGMSAAAKAKRVNKSVEITVYEKSDIISFGACGLPYFVGNHFEDKNTMIARTVEDMKNLGINVATLHEVVEVDERNKQVKVKNLVTNKEFIDNYDKLLIATGAKARIPKVDNLQLENIFYLRNMQDGINLKEAINKEENKNIIIIGAGVIGLEVAHAISKMGKNITIIQLDSRVLQENYDKEITDIIEKELIQHNIKVFTSEVVTQIKGDKKVTQVITDKGIYNADLVLISIGVIPNTDFLNGTSIKMHKGAILVDKFGMTNVDNIYAAGDCACIYNVVKDNNSYIPLATSASKMGKIIGENLAGKKSEFIGSLGSACLQVMDLEAGRTGLGEEEAKRLNIDYKTSFIKDKNQTDYYPGQEDIYVKLIYHAKTRVILGGQIIGKKGAVLRVNSLAVAIYNKMTTDELAMLDFCYSPPFSRTWDVLNVSGSVSK